ncbi:YIEGIA family protein [Clostridium sp. CCUG 7971]|uniref:YIEGIA family protein n=1 Tax=Clostridium sp. CCUG 7971 TaxID=2811414 RepID=UPI001ABBB011|nr:YIEGIA family protein [Clostridium sp. CCUG 7971]MBO3443286.1 YIEGIA family protein [Clostridium sp. CCUG 7971]
MNDSIINDNLFRHAFVVALVIGILCRGFVLRVTDRQYPSRPQDYLEQIIISGLSASLGAIALPALLDKEFSALTFFAVAIQQFQGLAQQERITLENIDNAELVPKGSAYVEEIATTYEARSYISLFSALAASVVYIVFARRYDLGFWFCTGLAIIAGVIVGLIFKRYLRRSSIGDIADVVPAKIHFEGSILKVNDVVITNIGLKDTKKRYLEKGLAIEIIPKSIGDFGIVNDLGQRDAIIHNIFIHMGIDKDVDEKDIITASRTDLDKMTVVLPYIPIKKDIDTMIAVIKSVPIIETAKGKQSAYKMKTQ